MIHENSVLGDRVVLRAHAVVGGQGFGFSTDEKGIITISASWGKQSSAMTVSLAQELLWITAL